MLSQWRILMILIGTFAFMVLVGSSGKPLQIPATPWGILHLEFAYTSDKALTIYRSWFPSAEKPLDLINVAKINTYWDFGFLLFYSSFLYLLLKKIQDFSNTRSRFWRMAKRLAPLCFVAAALDIVENVGILCTLHGNISTSTALLTALPSFLKWFLVILIVGFLLIALPVSYWKKTKISRNKHF